MLIGCHLSYIFHLHTVIESPINKQTLDGDISHMKTNHQEPQEMLSIIVEDIHMHLAPLQVQFLLKTFIISEWKSPQQEHSGRVSR